MIEFRFWDVFSTAFKNIDFVLVMEVLGGSNSVVECQLPKLDVAGSTPVSRSIFHTLRKYHRFLVTPFTPLGLWTRRFFYHGCFELVHRSPFLFQIRARIDFHADAETVTSLVCSDLGIDAALRR